MRGREGKSCGAELNPREFRAVIATDDKAFDQRMLRSMAERIGATITEVAASHAVFITQPKVVADVIHQAAQGSAESGR